MFAVVQHLTTQLLARFTLSLKNIHIAEAKRNVLIKLKRLLQVEATQSKRRGLSGRRRFAFRFNFFSKVSGW
jgi:hypothetical protein